MEGWEEGRREEEELEVGVVLRVCGHLRTHIRSLHPFLACWGPSHSCHTPLPKPPGLLKLSCLLVQFHFLTRQTRAGSACPFTPTGWLSAAVASVLVRKIKKEVKEAEAMEVPAGARIWA